MKHLKEFIFLIGLVHVIHKIYKTISMNKKSWKTTLFGGLAALCAFILANNGVELVTSNPQIVEILNYVVKGVAGLSGLLFAYFTKDKDVSGVAASLFLLVSLTFMSQNISAQTDTTNSFALGNLGGRTAVPINAYPLYKGYAVRNKDTTVIFKIDSFNYLTITNPYKGLYSKGDTVIIKSHSIK